jgi:ribosomal protein S12 methylthiotransferase accessory factor
MSMQIAFPGGVAVDASYRGHTIHTDQPHAAGGEGSGPTPSDLFLVSIGTCAGYYALRFCRERGLDTAGLALSLETERDPGREHLAVVRIEIELPPAFPAKYRAAVVRAAEQCKVKRQIQEPPRFEVVAVESRGAPLVPATI